MWNDIVPRFQSDENRTPTAAGQHHPNPVSSAKQAGYLHHIFHGGKLKIDFTHVKYRFYAEARSTSCPSNSSSGRSWLSIFPSIRSYKTSTLRLAIER